MNEGEDDVLVLTPAEVQAMLDDHYETHSLFPPRAPVEPLPLDDDDDEAEDLDERL
jgi:hypothetical protein